MAGPVSPKRIPETRRGRQWEHLTLPDLFGCRSEQQRAGSRVLFSLFAQADNLNHLSANLAYHTGSTREPMRFRVINYDQNDLPADALQTLSAGDTLRLQTRGMTTGQTDIHWLFRFTNLKAENPLQLWKMLMLTILLMAGIYGCILFSPPERQTKAEYLAYLLLLALMTLRSVLLWRVSTFLPVEDITPKVYGSLAALGWEYCWWGGVFCMGFFAIVMAWKVWGHKLLARFANLSSSAVFEPKLLAWVWALCVCPAGKVWGRGYQH